MLGDALPPFRGNTCVYAHTDAQRRVVVLSMWLCADSECRVAHASSLVSDSRLVVNFASGANNQTRISVHINVCCRLLPPLVSSHIHNFFHTPYCGPVSHKSGDEDKSLERVERRERVFKRYTRSTYLMQFCSSIHILSANRSINFLFCNVAGLQLRKTKVENVGLARNGQINSQTLRN